MECVGRPTLETIFQDELNRFSAKVLNGAPVIPESNEWYLVGVNAAATDAFYAIAEMQRREADPRTACCENLISIAELDGVYPAPATFSRGYVRLTGTPGAAIPANLTVSIGQGVYVIDAASTPPAVIGSNGAAVVQMQATTPGAKGNGTGSATGTMVSVAAGIDTAVTAPAGFCGGGDAEDCEAFRRRYLERLAFRPQADLAWITEKAMEWPCLTRVCVRQCDSCCDDGRWELFAFFDGAFENGIPPQAVVNDLTRWMFGARQGQGEGLVPFGVFGRFFAANPLPVKVIIRNLKCTSGPDLAEAKARIAKLFSGLCPGAKICRRIVEAAITQVVGGQCDFSVEFDTGAASIPCDSAGDLIAGCDSLPVLSEIIVL